MAKILITPRSLTRAGHPSFELLEQAGYEVLCCTPGQQPDEAELIRLLPGCLGYLAGVEKISAGALPCKVRLCHLRTTVQTIGAASTATGAHKARKRCKRPSRPFHTCHLDKRSGNGDRSARIQIGLPEPPRPALTLREDP